MKLYRVRTTLLTKTSSVTEGTKVYFHHIDKFGTSYFYTLRGTLALTLTKNQRCLVKKSIDKTLYL